jgi:hypothetical protein
MHPAATEQAAGLAIQPVLLFRAGEAEDRG